MGRSDLKGKTTKATVHWAGKNHPWSRKKVNPPEPEEATDEPETDARKLKTCPFCGQFVAVEVDKSGMKHNGYRYRYHIACPCGMARTGQEYTRETVERAWNRRVV